MLEAINILRLKFTFSELFQASTKDLENKFSLAFQSLMDSRKHSPVLKSFIDHDMLNYLALVKPLLSLGYIQNAAAIQAYLQMIAWALDSTDYFLGNPLTIYRVSVNELIDSLTLLKEAHPEKNIQLTIKLRRVTALQLHPGTLFTLINNIIINAYKHGKANIIKIDINLSPKKMTVIISDNGKGVNPMVLNHIFNIGFTTGSGDGLGLAQAPERLAQFNSTIIVEPHGGINQGAKFSIQISAPPNETV